MLYKLLICNCSAHRLNMSEDIYSIATIAVFKLHNVRWRYGLLMVQRCTTKEKTPAKLFIEPFIMVLLLDSPLPDVIRARC